MPGRPMLLHRMALVSFRLFSKNLGNLHEFFGQMVYCPPPPPAELPVCLWPTLYMYVFHNYKLITNNVNIPFTHDSDSTG